MSAYGKSHSCAMSDLRSLLVHQVSHACARCSSSSGTEVHFWVRTILVSTLNTFTTVSWRFRFLQSMVFHTHRKSISCTRG